MSRATQMAQVTAKGGLHLLWGLVVSTIISSLGTIFIARLLGSDSYGLYAIAIGAPVLFANFRDLGIYVAMVKYLAQDNTRSETRRIRNILVSGILFELILGSILSVISFVFSGFIANMFNRPEIAVLIQITSLTILTGSLINTVTCAFTGLEKMRLNSVLLVVQSIIKTSLIIALVLLGLGTLGSVIGFSVSMLLAAFTGLALLFTMYRSYPKASDHKLDMLENTKTMLKYGLPLSIGNIINGFLTQFYGYILAIFVLDNSLIGNYNVALNFVVLITFFATPVTTMLFPAFSKLDYNKDKGTIKTVFQFSVKYAALIVVPVTTMVIVLAQPAIATIFENRYLEAPLFLALLSTSYYLSALGSLGVSNLINSQGFTRFNLLTTILTAIVGFPLSYLLISQFGVIGLIVTSLTASLPSLVISLRFVAKKFNATIDYVSSAKILFTSISAGLLTFLLNEYLALHSVIELVIGFFVFIVLFILLAVITRTIDRSDIINIRDIASGFSPLKKLFNSLLNLIEKLMRILQR